MKRETASASCFRSTNNFCKPFMKTGARLDDLYDEALRDLMNKKGQPVTLHEALRQSAKMIAANDRAEKPRSKSKRLAPAKGRRGRENFQAD